MSKYNQVTYGSSYQGAARPNGFRKINAIDESKQLDGVIDSREQALEAESASIKAKYAVDAAQLAADKSKSNANFKAFEGLLSLSQQGMKMVTDYSRSQEIAAEKQKQKDLEDSINNEITSFLFGGEPTKLPAISEKEATQDAIALETSVAAGQITSNEQLQEDIIQPTADAVAARGITKVGTYQASASIGTDLQAFMESDAEVTLPDGRKILARDARTGPEISAVASAGIVTTTQGYGLAGMDPQVLQRTYLPSARAAYEAAVKARGTVNLQNSRYERITSAYAVANEAISSNQPIEGVWTDLTASLKIANPSLTNSEINEAARSHIIDTAVGMGLDGIPRLEALKRVQQRPGQKGTELGAGPYAKEIDKAIRAIRTGKVQEYNTTKAEAGIKMSNMQSEHQKALMAAKTSEERINLLNKYRDNLRDLAETGNLNALTEYEDSLKADGRRDIAVYRGFADDIERGIEISEDSVNEAVEAGYISADEGSSILTNPGAVIAEGSEKKFKDLQQGWKSTVGAKLKRVFAFSELSGEAGNYTQVIMGDINAQMKAYHKDHPDATPDEVSQAFEKAQAASLDKYITEGEGGKPTFVYPPSAPAQSYTNSFTGQQGRDLSHFSTQKIEELNNNSDISIISDNLISEEEFIAGAKALSSGSAQSARIRALARAAGTSPRNLLHAQAIGKGVDLEEVLSEYQSSQPSGSTQAGPTDIRSGTNYLHNTLGFSAIGSAYLSASIMQESSWNGQRDWGQVAGDGTSRNGGLISWASWANDPARLGVIENYLGKDISKATHAEQLQAMAWEMETNYPGNYRTFMNPDSTRAQLEGAVKGYWGYRDVGSRYTTYLDQARSAIT